MRAGQGFGRWGFVLGNVLIAFGAPVFVTSLVATLAAGSAAGSAGGSGPATGKADVVAIVAGAAFMIAGLVMTFASSRHRPAPLAEVEREYPRMVEPEREYPRMAEVEPKVVRPIEPLPLTLNTLDDYYAQSDVVEPLEEPLYPPRHVPRPRNSRSWSSGDRFCEPSTTATRSSGTRRRPQAG